MPLLGQPVLVASVELEQVDPALEPLVVALRVLAELAEPVVSVVPVVVAVMRQFAHPAEQAAVELLDLPWLEKINYYVLKS